MKKLSVLLASVLAVTPALGLAADNGGRPGAFLDYAASARSLGMGQAFTAVANDPSAIYWNPSGTALLPQKSLNAQFSTLMADASYGFVGYAQPVQERGGFGLGFVNLQSGSIPARDAAGNKTGSYQATSNALLLSGAYLARPNLSFGSTMKLVRESVDGSDGYGGGLDAGALYHLNPMFSLGLMLRNVVAPSVKLQSQSESYPRAVVAGLGVSPIKPLTLDVDVEQGQGTGVRTKFGADYNFNNLLSLRAGVNDAEFTAGLGIGVGGWSFDYALGYARASADIREFGSFQRFGVQFNFGAVQAPFAPAPAAPVPAVAHRSVRTKSATQRKEKAALKSEHEHNQPAIEELNQLGDRMDSWDGVPTAGIQKLVDDVTRNLKKGRYLKPADLYAAQGYVSYFTGEYARSVRSLESALKEDPGNAALESRLKRVQDLNVRPSTKKTETPEIRAVREKYEKGDYAGTILMAQRLLENEPKNTEAANYLKQSIDHLVQPYLRQAKDFLDHDRFVESFVQFQKALDYDPDNAEAKAYSERLVKIIEKKSDLDYLSRTAPKTDPELTQGIALYEKGLRLYGHGDLSGARAAWESSLPHVRDNQVLYDAVRSTIADIGH